MPVCTSFRARARVRARARTYLQTIVVSNTLPYKLELWRYDRFRARARTRILLPISQLLDFFKILSRMGEMKLSLRPPQASWE